MTRLRPNVKLFFFLIKVLIRALGIADQQPWTPAGEGEAQGL